MSEVTTEDMEMGDTHNKPCENTCRLSEEEREWVHTARKYVDSKHLPTVGKLLKMFDDLSYTIGKAVLGAIIVGGSALLLWWLVIRLKV